MRQLFVVCPCFNEEAVLASFTAHLMRVLNDLTSLPATAGSGPFRARVVFVDDGSRDGTWNVIRSLQEGSQGVLVSGVKLSRNFGHQGAVCAGLDHVMMQLGCDDADTVIIMDSDGQHPPGRIPEMMEARRAGFHHVQMIREDAATSGGAAKRLTSPVFYRAFSALSGLELRPGASDFRAFSGAFLRQYLRFAETNRFNRGLFVWMGFKTKLIPYRPEARIGGTSSYTMLRMFRLAVLGITYFSSRPLMMTTGWITGIGFLVCGTYILLELIKFLRGAHYVAGWPTIVFVVTLWGSLISLNQWILSAYVARIFDEVKRRPSYVVEEVL